MSKYYRIIAILQVTIAYTCKIRRDWNKVFALLLYLNIISLGQALKCASKLAWVITPNTIWLLIFSRQPELSHQFLHASINICKTIFKNHRHPSRLLTSAFSSTYVIW